MRIVFPPWASWVLLLILLLTFLGTWMLLRQVRELRATVGGDRPRSRKELDEAYKAGHVNREQYDYWRDRIK